MFLAVANQKGGVGKTTTAVNLAAELGARGKEVLVVDLDPQGSATSGLGVEVEGAELDLYDLFLGQCSLEQLFKETDSRGVSLVPGSRDLISLELELGKVAGRELLLRSALASFRERFDFILIDCPPSSGLLTLNALGAADGVVIPLQSEYYALEGLSQLTETISFVRTTFNPSLFIFGVVLTMFDSRTNLSSQVEREAKRVFGETVFSVRIPRTVRLSEAPSFGKPIRYYDKSSFGAKAYEGLAVEVLIRGQGEVKNVVGGK